MFLTVSVGWTWTNKSPFACAQPQLILEATEACPVIAKGGMQGYTAGPISSGAVPS